MKLIKFKFGVLASSLDVCITGLIRNFHVSKFHFSKVPKVRILSFLRWKVSAYKQKEV